MRKSAAIVIVAALGLVGVVVFKRSGGDATQAASASAAGGRGGRFGGPRAPMPVEFATVDRNSLTEQVLVVGNLIGAATVEVVPKVGGRLQSVNVKLGDTVRRGQILAKIEDLEIQQQVRQAEASFQVSQATIRQREADLKLAKSNLDRNKSLLDRQLLPVQTYEDTDARYQAALAQLDLAKAQFEQASSRLAELKITLGNTSIPSPVDGFVGKRFLDPGSFAGTNTPVASVVDIRTVRLVANLVEKDASRVEAGTPGQVEVDAFPGETFSGKVSRVAPVFDPATRTAEMEIEVANPGFRLKPGMYARVNLTVDTRQDALTVPRNAIVDLEGKTGVFVAEPPGAAQDGPSRGAGAAPGGRAGGAQSAPALVAKFLPVEIGIRSGDHVEVLRGLREGSRVITVGAGALRDGDKVVLATQERTGRESGQRGVQGQPQGQGPGAARPEATR
ncbi:MAG: efflux RND transporter periplasmic adaptor subunit [Vicinamibacterales bacterium]